MDVIDVLGEILADIEKQSADASILTQNGPSKKSINSPSEITTSTTTITSEQQGNNSTTMQEHHHHQTQTKSVRFSQSEDQHQTKEPSRSPIPPPLPPPPPSSINKLLQAPHHQPLQIVVDTLQVPGDVSFLHSPSRDILAGNNGPITPVLRTPSPRGDFGQKSPTVLTRTTTGGWSASPKVTDASEGVPVFSINDDNEDWNFQSYHLDYKYTPPPIKGPCCVCGEGIMGAMVTALDKMWHCEHFCCVHCGKELRSPNYTEHGGQPYCKACHNLLFLPPCAGCNKDIQGNYIQPLGKVLHADCFRCKHCTRVLSPDDFYERDGKAYCDDCRHDLFSPKCHGCKKPIKDERKVTAFGGGKTCTWHSMCFKCTKCHSVMNPNNYREKESKLYCEPCYNDLFMPKCGACDTPILQNLTNAMGKTFHCGCFTCKDCKKILTPDTFLEKNNKAFCEDCFHNRFSPKCAGCKKPIKDPKRLVTAQGKTWHDIHFCCTECGIQLNPNKFWEKEGLPYCEDDYHKLFSPKCAGCYQPIKLKPLLALEKHWHPEHFCCVICGKILSENEFYEKDGKAYCVDDYLRLFAPHCKQCGIPIIDDYCLVALGGDWHARCFRCRDCHCLLEDVNFFEINGEPYCEQHFHARQCPDCIRIRRAQNRYFGIPEDTPMQVKKWASAVSLKSLELNQRPLSQISQYSYASSNNYDRATPVNRSQRSSYILPIEEEDGRVSSSLSNKDVHHIHDHNGICFHDQLVEEIQRSVTQQSTTSRQALTTEEEKRVAALGGKAKGWKRSQDNLQFIAKNQSPYVYTEPGKFPVLEQEKHIRFEEVVTKREYEPVRNYF